MTSTGGTCVEHRWTPDYDRCKKGVQVYRCTAPRADGGEGCGLWAKRNFHDGTFVIVKEAPEVNTYWDNWAAGVVDLDADVDLGDDIEEEGPLVPLDFDEGDDEP